MSKTLVEVLDQTASLFPDRKLQFPALGETLTYQELMRRALRLAGGLRLAGVERGQSVGMLFPTCPEFLVSFFGIVAAGASVSPIARPVSPHEVPTQLDKLRRVLDVGDFGFLLAHPALEPLLAPVLDGTRTHLLRSAEVMEGPLAPAAAGPEDLALIQFTSGSTSQPKGVALRHRHLLAAMRAILVGARVDSSDVNGQWLPLHHDMGLIGMLAGILAGLEHHIWPSFSFIRNPGRWLEEFSRRRCTVYAGPNFSYQQMLVRVSDAQLGALDLTSCRVAFNGAEPIDADCLESFLGRFARAGFRPTAMFPVYGLAEATLAAAFPELGAPIITHSVDRERLANHREVAFVDRDHARARTLVSVGRAIHGHELRIVDDDGRPLAPELVGHIELRGPAVMDAYHGMTPAESGISDDGWLRTGDLGYCSDGSLFVSGRVKEMIIIHGMNFYANDVEQLVADVPGVFRNRCVAFGIERARGERIALLVEARLGDRSRAQELANALRVRVTNGLAVTGVEVYVLRPNTIEYTTSGKVRRVLMRERLLLGRLTEDIVGESSLTLPAASPPLAVGED